MGSTSSEAQPYARYAQSITQLNVLILDYFLFRSSEFHRRFSTVRELSALNGTNANTVPDTVMQRKEAQLYPAFVAPWGRWLIEIVLVFFTLENGATVGHLGFCIKLPLAACTDPGGKRARCGTKHSISTSDITAVSSAVSACAINSVAEGTDCLCRKYLTPDPKPGEE